MISAQSGELAEDLSPPLAIDAFMLPRSSNLSETFTLILQWLELRSLMALDSAVSCRIDRPVFLAALVDFSFPLLRSVTARGLIYCEICWMARRVSTMTYLQCQPDADDFIVGCLAHCPCLVSLSLARCTLITDASVIALSDIHCLRHLVLSGCCNVTDIALVVLSERCPHLQSLDVRGCDVTDRGLARIAMRCSSLLSIKISGASFITALDFIATGCRGLSSISFSRCISISEISIQSLIRNTALTSITTQDCNMTDATLNVIASTCPSIEHLTLFDCPFTDMGLLSIAYNCILLKSISLRSNTLTNMAVIVIARHCKLLSSIQLSMPQVTDESLVVVSQELPRLERIQLKCGRITDHGIISLAQGCSKLQCISFEKANISDLGVIVIADNCRRLRVLSLIDCGLLTGDALSKLLIRCPLLKIIRI
jgi:hypothetical protein